METRQLVVATALTEDSRQGIIRDEGAGPYTEGSG